MNIVLIGCGLIGGSIVLDVRSKLPSVKVLGIDTNAKHLERAIEIGLIDGAGTLEDLKQADQAILATPVNVASDIIISVLNHLGPKTTLMDVGSTKRNLCEIIDGHEKRPQFVATHPIAGTEYSGPDAAFEGLFDNRIALICEKDKSSASAIEMVLDVYRMCGSRIIEMDPVEHDRHLAYVSHLSHISSFTLGLTVLDIEKNEKNISMLAGSGFESTVRLANSSPAMWEPIFLENSKDLLQALDEYILHLKDFREMIASDDGEGLTNQMTRANEIARILGLYSQIK
jgi:prephenate dehydrogenase